MRKVTDLDSTGLGLRLHQPPLGRALPTSVPQDWRVLRFHGLVGMYTSVRMDRRGQEYKMERSMCADHLLYYRINHSALSDRIQTVPAHSIRKSSQICLIPLFSWSKSAYRRDGDIISSSFDPLSLEEGKEL